MGEFQKEFLKQSICHLEEFQKELQSTPGAAISEDFSRRLFRQIHTIKGTAQTFDYKGLASIAHYLESYLQAANTKTIPDEKDREILEEALGYLLKFCQNDQLPVPTEFFDKINQLLPDSNKLSVNQNLSDKIPQNLLSQISAQEKAELNAAIENGNHFYLIEVFFELLSFNSDFVSFREELNKLGKVIAVSSSPNASPGAIGFRFFFVSNLLSEELKSATDTYKAIFVFESDASKEKYSDDLSGLLQSLTADCKKKSQILGKEVSFEISAEAVQPSTEKLTLIRDIALHLIRNAIDHAIESPTERTAANKPSEGTIKISVLDTGDDILLRVEDDGKGIDAKEIIKKARNKGLITDDESPNEKEALDLIFAHGFSTSETISEISGRGVGLDAVKDLVDKAGGIIEVKTQIGCGTVFEVTLPR